MAVDPCTKKEITIDILFIVGYTGNRSDGFSPGVSRCGCNWRRKGSSAIDGCKAGWISLFSAVFYFAS